MQQLNGQYENCSYKPLTRLISRICIWWFAPMDRICLRISMYSLTHTTKKKNRIEEDEKTKKTEWKQNKAESEYWAYEVLSAHCDQFHFILSFVDCMGLFFIIFRARGFILHYFTFLPSSRNFPGIFYYYLLAFFKLCCVFFPAWFFNWELSSECLFVHVYHNFIYILSNPISSAETGAAVPSNIRIICF